MKSVMAKNKVQMYSVGNYLMTGKVLGKGHFARVEEATHRIIGKKVAIKIIDLTCIKEEYARRHLHREPRVMAKLRHPCIAALYETMMHGPRLYVVMEAAGGGDLCAHVVEARGGSGRATGRGLPETRARPLAAQLVSAVRHMHSRGVVHRDLKMENIMLDSTKQFIKIVDFGLSNVWSAGGALRTPCGSLEYAAPELFLDGRRYGPEVDLWSIGVIVYGMATGALPFSGGAAETGSRPQLRAAIQRGFGRTQRAALAFVSGECKAFIQHLLEPNVELRMKIEEASRHRWVRKPGMRMKTQPLANLEPKISKEIVRQISELSGQTLIDVIAQIKADPFGSVAGMFNIKTHLSQLQAVKGADLLWAAATQGSRSASPAEVEPNSSFTHTSNMKSDFHTIAPPNSAPSHSKPANAASNQKIRLPNGAILRSQFDPKAFNGTKTTFLPTRMLPAPKPITIPDCYRAQAKAQCQQDARIPKIRSQPQSPRSSIPSRAGTILYGLKKPTFKVHDDGDCGLDPRLPSIDEHSNADLTNGKSMKARIMRSLKKITADDEHPMRLSSCPAKFGDTKKTDFYRRAGDGLPSWRAGGVTSPARILLQSNATNIKRASLGNIVSPHSSSNSHCKSERSMPVGWYATRSSVAKEQTHLQRFRRTVPMK